MINDIYGGNFLESSSNRGHVGFLLKMLVELFPWESMTSSLTWKVKATPQKRSYYQLVPRTRRTDETGYGLLPTVLASDAGCASIIGKEDKYKLTKNGTLRRYNKNGKNSSLSLGRLIRLKTGYNLTPELAETMMGYPIGWTELKR